MCSGAFVLARAGFLDSVETAIHWGCHDLVAERFPEVRLRRSVFVARPHFDTALGGTATADLMLHLIARAGPRYRRRALARWPRSSASGRA